MVKIKLKLTNLIVVKSLMSTLLQLTIFTWVWWGRIWRLWWRGRGCPRNRWTGVSGHTQCCPSSCYRDSQYVREEKTKRKREIRKVKTWKGSRRSLLMQALLQPQEPIHEGFHTCIIFSIYDHIFQGDCINKVVHIFYLSKRKPPALVLTLPPMWQLPWKYQLIFCHILGHIIYYIFCHIFCNIFVVGFWLHISTLAPRSSGTIIPWSAKAESSVSRTTPAWT